MGDISKLLNPKTIALIGAAGIDGAGYGALRENLLHQRGRRVYLVNPGGKAIEGLPNFRAVSDIPEHVDLAVIASRAGRTPGFVEACGKAGVDGAIIISSAFRATQASGKAPVGRIKAAAEKYGLRIIGPGSLGVIAPHADLNASIFHVEPVKGKTAFIYGSGPFGRSFLESGVGIRMGFSLFASLGSMVDLDLADVIDFLGADPHTKGIIIYVEDDLGNVKNFFGAAREAAGKKPVIIFKPATGAAKTGKAQTHTGALAGAEHACDALFRRIGAIRVKRAFDLFSVAGLLGAPCLPQGPRLLIITDYADLGVAANRKLMAAGGMPAVLSPETADELRRILPSCRGRGNFLVVTEKEEADCFADGLRVCLEDPGVDGVLVAYKPRGDAAPQELADALAAVSRKAWKPLVVSLAGGRGRRRDENLFLEKGVPVCGTPEGAVGAYLCLYRYRQTQERLYETPEELHAGPPPLRRTLEPLIRGAVKEGRSVLTQPESLTLLFSYGVPVLETVPEKSDYGLIIGAKKDPVYGAVILFGAGGAALRKSGDFSLGMPPLNQIQARRLMEETKVFRKLWGGGLGARPAADMKQLEGIIVSFSNLIVDFPEIAEADVHPIALSGGRAYALGARIVLDKSCMKKAAPHSHLLIAPYPCRYERPCILGDGRALLLRPVRPEDAPLLCEMYGAVSEEAYYGRFLQAGKPDPQIAARQCTIDYGREMGIVAEIHEKGKRRLIGMACLSAACGSEGGEYAVIVHDDFQGRGIGRKLLEIIIAIARERGFREIFGIVLANNKKMLGLCRGLGFAVEGLPEGLKRVRLHLDADVF